MKILHNILKGVSLTGALFVFQACYGMPEPAFFEEGGTAPMSFTLVSHADGKPLEGVNIKASDWDSKPEKIIGVTDENGKCTVQIPYRRNLEGPYIEFQAPAGSYYVKDTVLTDLRERDILVKLDPVI